MSHSNRYDLVGRGIPSKVDKDKIFPEDINIFIECVPFVSDLQQISLRFDGNSTRSDQFKFHLIVPIPGLTLYFFGLKNKKLLQNFHCFYNFSINFLTYL